MECRGDLFKTIEVILTTNILAHFCQVQGLLGP